MATARFSGGSDGGRRAELARHAGVTRGDAAGIVRDQPELDAVVTNVNVGMMIRFLRQLGHAVDEADRQRAADQARRTKPRAISRPPSK